MSGNIYPFPNMENTEKEQKEVDNLLSRVPLKGGGGGGTFDGMEAVWKKFEEQDKRFDKLDAKVERVQDSVNSIRTDLARIEGRLNAMPTTIQLIGFVIAIFVAAGLLKYFGN